MAFWWVNHKQTRDHEVRGGYLWSPYRNANGAFNQTYENMRHAQVGDIVFSFAFGKIGAVGRVTAAALPSPKPIEFGAVGDYWASEGWLVEVEFVAVPKPLHPTRHIQTIGPLLPLKHSPIQRTGHGNQGCYLAGISDSLGLLLLELLGAAQLLLPAHQIREPELRGEVLEDLREVDANQAIPDTYRLQLSKARIGQGFFRKQVLLLDDACRVTGVSDARVLVASHIKPWRSSSNAERLSGFNGVLLSPHVDALFDDYLMTFEDDGRMHFHPSLEPDVLERWAIDPDRRVEAFRAEQAQFLLHHRDRFASRPRA